MRVVPQWRKRFGVHPLARTNHRGFDRAFHSMTGDYHGRKEGSKESRQEDWRKEGGEEGCQEGWRKEGCKEGRRSQEGRKEGQEVSFRSSTTEKPAPWRRLLSLCHLVYR